MTTSKKSAVYPEKMATKTSVADRKRKMRQCGGKQTKPITTADVVTYGGLLILPVTPTERLVERAKSELLYYGTRWI